MSLLPANLPTIPAKTRHVAQAAFPKGNLYVRWRDEFGPLYEDEALPTCFRPADDPRFSFELTHASNRSIKSGLRRSYWGLFI
jgi:hypothetical protein